MGDWVRVVQSAADERAAMKHVFRILICLLLGAVTTVGVAWGLAWLRPYAYRPPGNAWSWGISGFSHAEGARWYVNVGGYAGTVWTHRSAQYQQFIESGEPDAVIGASIPRWSDARKRPSARDTPPTAGSRHIVEFAHGWPLVALFYEVEFDMNATRSGTLALKPRNGLVIQTPSSMPTWPNELHVLPVRPIASGLLFNTLCYGVIWFALLFGFALLRPVVRRRRGRCPACGYELKAAAREGCPECGWKREEAAEHEAPMIGETDHPPSPLHPPLADEPAPAVLRPKGKVWGIIYLVVAVVLLFWALYLAPDVVGFWLGIVGAWVLVLSALQFLTYPVRAIRLDAAGVQIESAEDVMSCPWSHVKSIDVVGRVTKRAAIRMDRPESLVIRSTGSRTPVRSGIYIIVFVLLLPLSVTFLLRPDLVRYVVVKDALAALKLNRKLFGAELVHVQWQLGMPVADFVRLCRAFKAHYG